METQILRNALAAKWHEFRRFRWHAPEKQCGGCRTLWNFWLGEITGMYTALGAEVKDVSKMSVGMRRVEALMTAREDAEFEIAMQAARDVKFLSSKDDAGAGYQGPASELNEIPF